MHTHTHTHTVTASLIHTQTHASHVPCTHTVTTSLIHRDSRITQIHIIITKTDKHTDTRMHVHIEIHLDISRQMHTCSQIHILTATCPHPHRHVHAHTHTKKHTQSRYLNASPGTHHYRFSHSLRSHELLTLKARLGSRLTPGRVKGQRGS